MVRVALSAGYEPQSFCLVFDVNAEMVADPCHAVDRLALVGNKPSVVSHGVIVVGLWTFVSAQIVAVPPCLSISETDNLSGGESRVIRNCGTAG